MDMFTALPIGYQIVVAEDGTPITPALGLVGPTVLGGDGTRYNLTGPTTLHEADGTEYQVKVAVLPRPVRQALPVPPSPHGWYVPARPRTEVVGIVYEEEVMLTGDTEVTVFALCSDGTQQLLDSVSGHSYNMREHTVDMEDTTLVAGNSVAEALAGLGEQVKDGLEMLASSVVEAAAEEA
jgi:hypothetical protein